MELKQYIMLLKHWAWLIILGLILGISGGYILTQYQTPIYQASTKILIMQAPDDPALDLSSMTDKQYAQTFTELLVTRPVIQATSERLGYRVSSGQVRVQTVGDAQIIQVTVTDNDPDQAAGIANTLVEVFLEQNEQLQASRFSSSEQSLTAQLEQVESTISDLRSRMSEVNVETFDNRLQEVTRTIADLQTEILTLKKEVVALEYPKEPVESLDDRGRTIMLTPTASLEERTDLTLKQDRLSELQGLLRMYQELYVQFTFTADTSGNNASRNTEQIQAALALYEQIYTNLLSNYEAVRLARLKSTPNVVQVEAAMPNQNPISPRPVTNMTLGGIIGLLLTGAIAYLVEYLDDTLRTQDEVAGILQLPVLGYIGEMARSFRNNGRSKDAPAGQPYVLDQPRSPIAEAFRSLRTNLEFVELDKPLQIILVTSPGLSEGKTTIASNLAFVIAQSGKKVILLDADLRRPRVHTVLGLPNRSGISDVFRTGREAPEVEIGAALQAVAQPTSDACLSVITSGALPPNPVEVLSSNKMAAIISELRQQAEVVIIDGPPFLLADASLLSVKADGVLVVVQLNRTQAGAALTMLEQLNRVGARLLGVVINRIDLKNPSFYYKNIKDYHYFSYESDLPQSAGDRPQSVSGDNNHREQEGEPGLVPAAEKESRSEPQSPDEGKNT